MIHQRYCLSFGLALGLYMAGSIDSAIAGVCLVSGGTPNGFIVIPDNLPAPTKPPKKPLWIEFNSMHSHDRTSAEILAKYILESTGAELPIVTEGEAPASMNAIHVGSTTAAQGHAADLTDINSDGFLITTTNEKTVFLTGASPQGTEFAVYDFLERELGVRWLFPGKLGEHVPTHADLCVSGPDYVSAPAYHSRLFWVRGEGGAEWTRRNRIHSRIEFHHNLSKLIPISFTKNNPEFFPVIDGERHLPTQMIQQDWHLCYSADGVAGAVADLLVRNLDSRPEFSSVSIGVSDATDQHYCQCALCLPRRGEGMNSLGYPHYSDMYFKWANEVVDTILTEYPDLWVGCSAYREVADPPSFTVNERLVPYLTWELLQWAEPSRREAWKTQLKAWARKAPHLGHYEYMFGEEYMLVPRLYIHALADYLQLAKDHGVIGFYAETTGSHTDTIWYAGPQPYILQRLLWDPQADVDMLLRDWCFSAVGEKAGPFLEAWFRHWEQIWTKRVPQTDWFDTRSRTYLKFNSDGYLAAVTPKDLDLGERQLLRVVKLSPEGRGRQRAEMFLAEFQKRRAEHLDYQVTVWAAENRIRMATLGEPIQTEGFEQKPERWVTFSPIHSNALGHDAELGAMRFSGDATIKAPKVSLEPGQTYAVSWRMKVKDISPTTILSFVMTGNPVKGVGQAVTVTRHVQGPNVSTNWQFIQHAFHVPPDATEGMRLGCMINTRGVRSGSILLDSFFIAPIDQL